MSHRPEDKEALRAIGARLREAREAAGMTQAEVADALGMTAQAVSGAERKGIARVALLARFAEALGADPAGIAFGDNA